MRAPYRLTFILLTLFIISSLCACGMINTGITIVDAKTATGLDERLMPIRATDTFPKDTSKVWCWMQWKGARINTQILASWHYITDDIHILDYSFNIPKKDGTGGVVLSMPGNKNLPPGSYKVDLSVERRALKSLKFTVE